MNWASGWLGVPWSSQMLAKLSWRSSPPNSTAETMGAAWDRWRCRNWCGPWHDCSTTVRTCWWPVVYEADETICLVCEGWSCNQDSHFFVCLCFSGLGLASVNHDRLQDEQQTWRWSQTTSTTQCCRYFTTSIFQLLFFINTLEISKPTSPLPLLQGNLRISELPLRPCSIVELVDKRDPIPLRWSFKRVSRSSFMSVMSDIWPILFGALLSCHVTWRFWWKTLHEFMSFFKYWRW